jgi:hypothetical protein
MGTGSPFDPTLGSPPGWDRPPLAPVPGGYRCPACGTEYPIVDGVAVLMRPELARDLGVL